MTDAHVSRLLNLFCSTGFSLFLLLNFYRRKWNDKATIDLKKKNLLHTTLKRSLPTANEDTETEKSRNLWIFSTKLDMTIDV